MTRPERRVVVAAACAMAILTLASEATAQRRHRKRHRRASPTMTTPASSPVTPSPTPVGPKTKTDDASSPDPMGGVVQVTVVEVAGGRVYVQPGSKAGLHKGAQVILRGKAFRVSQVSANYGVLDADAKLGIREGTRGSAKTSRVDEAVGVERLPQPRSLGAFRGQWVRAERPSVAQSPKFVPLGAEGHDKRFDVQLAMAAGGIVPLDGSGKALGRGELRARVHAEPVRDTPLAIDADAAMQLWVASDLSTREGDSSRPLLRVRELQLAYGYQQGLFAALGRMRYAASTLGMLDGARVQTALGQRFSIGAFGGVVPDPMGGRPAFDASRFGVELGYADMESSLRPTLNVVGHGSVFQSHLDERRLSAALGLFPGDSRIGAHVEVSAFDKNNPWNASPVEVTAAGADASIRKGIVQVGARVDLRQQERSRWLASLLPQGWLCVPVAQAPQDPPVTAPCASPSSNTRYLASLDGGLDFGNVVVTAGGTGVRTGGSGPDQLGAYVQLRAVRVFGRGRFDVSANGSKGSLLVAYGGNVGAGASLLNDVLDVSVYYRPGIVRYEADLGSRVQHTFGSALVVTPNPSFMLTLQGDALAGGDINVLLVQTTATWRPQF